MTQLIWSTQEDTRQCLPVEGGPRPPRFAVPPMDAKGEANALFLERGLPVTLLLASFFWENLLGPILRPQRTADGRLELRLPLGDARLPGIAAADIGACAAALFAAAPAQRRVGIAGDHLTGAEMAAAWAGQIGEPVRFVDTPIADHARQTLAGAADWASVFEFQQRCHSACCAARPVASTRTLHPGLLDFRGWMRLHARRVAIASRHGVDVAS